MKYIEIDEELYRYIASNTLHIGESASDILRRLLDLELADDVEMDRASAVPETVSQPSLEKELAAETAAVVTPRRQARLAAVSSSVSDPAVFETLIGDPLVETQKGAVGRFLYLLDCLYRQHPGSFEGVLEIRGRDRLYFAQSKEALLKASQTANPKQIGASHYWVSANNNTPKKRAILSEVLMMLGCPTELIQRVVAQL